MSVNYVNGANATTGATSGVTQTINYSPTPGNMVVLGISFGASVTNLVCVDNNGNALTLANPLFGNGALFYGVAAAGATSYTVSWTTSRKSSIAIVEYSGCMGVGNTDTTFQTASSLNYSLTTPVGYFGSVVVALISSATSNLTYTASTGTIEQQVTGGAGAANNVCLMDNTTAPAVPGANVVLSGTITTSGACFEQEVELYPGQPITESSSNDDQWLGGEVY